MFPGHCAPSLWCAFSLSCTRFFSLALSLYPTLSLALSLALSLYPTLSLALSLALSLYPTLSLALSLVLSLYLALSLALSLAPYFISALFIFLPRSLPLARTSIHANMHVRTHTHKHTYTHTHTHTHTYTHTHTHTQYLAGKMLVHVTGWELDSVLSLISVSIAACCTLLQCSEVCCSVLHICTHDVVVHNTLLRERFILYTASLSLFLSAPPPAAIFCSVLRCVAACCSVVQCVAACCGVLQCVAVCCKLSWSAISNHMSVLQCDAV